MVLSVQANIGSKADVAFVKAKAEAGPVCSCAALPPWSVADLAAERDNVAAQSDIFNQVQVNIGSEADLAARRDNVAAQSDIFNQVQANMGSEADLAARRDNVAAQSDIFNQDERDEQAKADLNEEVERYLRSDAYNAAAQARSEADLAAHHGHFADQGERMSRRRLTLMRRSEATLAAHHDHADHQHERDERSVLLNQAHFDLAEEVQPYPQSNADNAAVHARSEADLADHQDHAYHQDGRAQQSEFPQQGQQALLVTHQAKVQAINAAIPAWSEAYVASFHANMEAGRAADRAQRARVLNHREAGCSAFGDTVFGTIGN
eukprot:gene14679-20716_t